MTQTKLRVLSKYSPSASQATLPRRQQAQISQSGQAATGQSGSEQVSAVTGQWAIHSNIAGNENDQACKLVVTDKQNHRKLQISRQGSSGHWHRRWK